MLKENEKTKNLLHRTPGTADVYSTVCTYSVGVIVKLGK